MDSRAELTGIPCSSVWGATPKAPPQPTAARRVGLQRPGPGSGPAMLANACARAQRREAHGDDPLTPKLQALNPNSVIHNSPHNQPQPKQSAFHRTCRLSRTPLDDHAGAAPHSQSRWQHTARSYTRHSNSQAALRVALRSSCGKCGHRRASKGRGGRHAGCERHDRCHRVQKAFIRNWCHRGPPFHIRCSSGTTAVPNSGLD
eukprot:366240-Chlamydomonas_euryale.AAC.8